MTIQVGIIGTGWFGMMHAEKLSKIADVKVIAFTATTKEKSRSCKHRSMKELADIHLFIKCSMTASLMRCMYAYHLSLTVKLRTL